MAGISDPSNTTSRLLERHGIWLGACLALGILALTVAELLNVILFRVLTARRP